MFEMEFGGKTGDVQGQLHLVRYVKIHGPGRRGAVMQRAIESFESCYRGTLVLGAAAKIPVLEGAHDPIGMRCEFDYMYLSLDEDLE